MREKMKAMKNLSDAEIAQMFWEYVERMEDQERHTEAACQEVDLFDSFCEKELPLELQAEMYDRMMDCAVEFELSGFIAGFHAATASIFDQEAFLPHSTHSYT